MPKIDTKKELEHLYHASARDVAQVEVPPLRYLMVDGSGDPNTSPWYAQAVEALFSVAYTAKFMLKKEAEAINYSVMPLEGLWWADDPSAFLTNDRERWHWTMMIMQPSLISSDVMSSAITDVCRKKGRLSVEALRLETFLEGHCAQILHIGPFVEEGPTIERLHAYIRAHGELTGKHHEIYLSDIRRADPRKWRTIIRQPMRCFPPSTLAPHVALAE